MTSERNRNRATPPVVSVVVPMLDEAGFIEPCLDGFEKQTWPLDRLEVIVCDAGSRDGSRETVERLAGERPWLRMAENPRGRISAGFNIGVRAAHGEIICLFSAHGVPAPDFVERSVAALLDTGAGGVGGRLEHQGTDRVAAAIGVAMTSRLGMASPFRFRTSRSEVDTIGHPAYLRRALEQAGPFDESLGSNEDYELNWRIRDHGYRIVFDPSITSTYRPRSDLRSLGAQFWRYGRWKAVMVRDHPRSIRWRHLAPPVLAVWVVLAPLVALRSSGRRLIVLSLVGYGAGVLTATVASLRRVKGESVSVPALVAAFPTMHLCWGFGFLSAWVAPPRRTLSGG